MPSLRELWRQVILFDKREMSPRLYAVMEALVEAVEPEETPLLAKEWDEAQATIRKLRIRLEREREELAEAKAEIERLRKRKAWWEHSVKSWKAEEISWREEMNELHAELESLRADAEIGRLVRGMAGGSRLSVLTYDLYRRQYAAYQWDSAECDYRLVRASTPDPAEALRDIQEVGDA